MTPQLRPIKDLTPEALETASHWCIRWSDKALIVPAREITVFHTIIDAYGLSFSTGSDSKTTCYPCTLHDDGRVDATLWPVLDGEEEILEWKGVDSCSKYWTAGDEANVYWQPYAYGPDHPSLLARPGFTPEKRLKHRWVWAKNTEKKGTS